jgi:hypothetical protein
MRFKKEVAARPTLQREEQRQEAQLTALRSAVDQGDQSGVALGYLFAGVWKTLKLT